ncbi:hypothetical protein L6278_01445 [Candidatus Parcubacteria bacterium]|nr:hypothetical protein [Patescibacteria group bacterium]MBU4481846.1 hypothetical protein [Patescibacteria group bacterium]MCG2686785.1 hypothetical protein [Candidatus Parcubacteria bacterium]
MNKKIILLRQALARSPDGVNISFSKGKFGFGGFDINKIDVNGKIEIFFVKGASVIIEKEERKNFFKTLKIWETP